MTMILLKAGQQWNPLETPLQEYIPECWIGPHVGLRLCESFKTLAMMPMLTISKKLGYWPEYLHDYEDVQNQKVDISDEIAIDRAVEQSRQNRTRMRPTAKQISQMDAALYWAGHFIRLPAHARLVQKVAMYRARDFELETIARRMRMNPRMMRNANREALDCIAIGLRREAVRVF